MNTFELRDDRVFLPWDAGATMQLGDKEITIFLENNERGDTYRLVAEVQGRINYPMEMLSIYEASLYLSTIVARKMAEEGERASSASWDGSLCVIAYEADFGLQLRRDYSVQVKSYGQGEDYTFDFTVVDSRLSATNSCGNQKDGTSSRP